MCAGYSILYDLIRQCSSWTLVGSCTEHNVLEEGIWVGESCRVLGVLDMIPKWCDQVIMVMGKEGVIRNWVC